MNKKSEEINKPGNIFSAFLCRSPRTETSKNLSLKQWLRLWPLKIPSNDNDKNKAIKLLELDPLDNHVTWFSHLGVQMYRTAMC